MSSIRSKRAEAQEKVQDEIMKLDKIKELKSLVQYKFGMGKISKGRIGVSTDEFLSCLMTLLNLPEETSSRARTFIQGNSLEIIGSGRSCQIGDDGSILIPHDWR